MKLNSKLTPVVLGMAILLWAYFLFFVPTLDFDEALYRSVVQSMKAAHDPWHLYWDGNTLFHKPPVFYWLVWFFSFIIDGSNGAVSSFAARLPSFFSTIGILIYLYRSGERFETGGTKTIGRNAVLAFLGALFPMMTATSVLFDPLQTLCFMPSLVIPALLFFKSEEVKARDWIWWSISLFAASATKGLNGLIVPTFAFGVHSFLSARLYGFKKVSSLLLKFSGWVFLPATVLTAIYYFWLNQKIGPAFTHEFIWIQHFERGTSPMEQHSGSFFYHFFVIFFGGGILIPVLADRIASRKPSFVRYSFPLTYSLSFMLIFGLSATKLPHYSWPVWPALALYIGLLSPLAPKKLNSFWFRFADIPVLLLGVALALLAIAPAWSFHWVSRTPSSQGVLHYFSGFTGFETTALLSGALVCFGMIAFKSRMIQSLEACAIGGIFVALMLSLGIGPTINHLLVEPFYQIANRIKQDPAKPSDCIWYSGSLSPTLSLALSPELLHNRCDPSDIHYLVAPEWKAKECAERNFKVINQEAYLVLCKKG